MGSHSDCAELDSNKWCCHKFVIAYMVADNKKTNCQGGSTLSNKDNSWGERGKWEEKTNSGDGEGQTRRKTTSGGERSRSVFMLYLWLHIWSTQFFLIKCCPPQDLSLTPFFFRSFLNRKSFFSQQIQHCQLFAGYRNEANIFIFPFLVLFGYIMIVAKKLCCQEPELNQGKQIWDGIGSPAC